MKKILVLASMMLIGFSGAYAAGTASGTVVKNNVSLTYTVGGVSQTNILADDADGFVVDTKIDFTVTNDDSTQIAVTPGDTAKVTQWTVTNTGNAVTFFTLASSNLVAGETVYSNADTADTGTQTVTISTDGTTYSAYAGATSIPVDVSLHVRVASDIPLSATNGDVMNIQLLATATDAGGAALASTSGSDTKDSVDIVLAEGAGVTTEGNTAFDGKFSAWGGYIVQSASLTATKGSCVIWDPVNITTNPKRIPGAVVRYTIQVTNGSGTQDAIGVAVTDILDTSLTYGTTTPAPTAVAIIVTEACNCISPGTANGGTVGESSGTVTATYASPIHADQTQCAYFDVTIN